jgi:hypothetical protein
VRPEETATDYLHGLHRRIVRARFGRSGNSRLKRMVKRAVAPLYWYVQPVVQAIPAVRLQSKSVKSAYGVGTIRQLAGCVAFTASFRAGASSYFEYRLFLREYWARRSEYLYHDEMWLLLAWLNRELGPRDAADLSDKRRFHDRASRVGLPVIPVLAEFECGAILRKASAGNPASDLFSKFADRWDGEGARAWRRGADGTYADDQGAHLTVSQLYGKLCALSVEHPLILQPRVSNHPELRAVSGNGLSTVRAVTVRDTRGRIALALACFRMPVGALVADNFAAGGLAAPITLHDGRLGSAVFKSRAGVFDAHPGSGAAIRGRYLPHWSKLKRLAVAAHAEFKTLPAIGWDIAITADGPVIVEGNSEWGTNVVQMSHQMPLDATVIPVRLVEHFAQLEGRSAR